MKTLKQLVPNLWVRLMLVPVVMAVMILVAVFAAVLMVAGEQKKSDSIIRGVDKFLGAEN